MDCQAVLFNCGALSASRCVLRAAQILRFDACMLLRRAAWRSTCFAYAAPCLLALLFLRIDALFTRLSTNTYALTGA